MEVGGSLCVQTDLFNGVNYVRIRSKILKLCVKTKCCEQTFVRQCDKFK